MRFLHEKRNALFVKMLQGKSLKCGFCSESGFSRRGSRSRVAMVAATRTAASSPDITAPLPAAFVPAVRDDDPMKVIS